MEQPTQQLSFWDKNKTLLKGLLIGGLTLIMLMPTAYIMVLTSERQERQREVITEISKKWATDQTITGPILTIPYFKVTVDGEGKELKHKKEIHLLPKELKINGEVMPEVRHRSIYDVTVYRSSLDISGSYDYEALSKLHISDENIDWENIRLSLGIVDAHGLEENPELRWENKRYVMEASNYSSVNLEDALSVNLTSTLQNESGFNIKLKLKGTGQLYFTPTGRSTTVKIKSPSGTPAFDGKYLPDRIPELRDTGFSAQWKILQVSNNYPRYWFGNDNVDFKSSAFGVRLIQQAGHYTKTERSIKYAILIISLTFLVFFFIEMLQKKRIHPLQYILVGFALIIFYVLLLSISEYAGFNIAYLIAAAATVGLITWYIKSIFSKNKIAFGFFFTLSSLYTYIFFLIQLEDYALLFGSIGLFCILAVVMYYSRNIDWYHTEKKINDEQ